MDDRFMYNIVYITIDGSMVNKRYILCVEWNYYLLVKNFEQANQDLIEIP